MEYAITELKKKVENLEYKEIEPLKQRVSHVETNNALTEQLCQQMAKSFDKMGETMDSVKETMISMNLNMENSSKEIKDMKSDMLRKFDDVNKKFDGVDTKISEQSENLEKVNNKTKIDTSSTIKNAIEKGIIWLISGGGIVFLVNYLTNNMG